MAAVVRISTHKRAVWTLLGISSTNNGWTFFELAIVGWIAAHKGTIVALLHVSGANHAFLTDFVGTFVMTKSIARVATERGGPAFIKRERTVLGFVGRTVQAWKTFELVGAFQHRWFGWFGCLFAVSHLFVLAGVEWFLHLTEPVAAFVATDWIQLDLPAFLQIFAILLALSRIVAS